MEGVAIGEIELREGGPLDEDFHLRRADEEPEDKGDDGDDYDDGDDELEQGGQ